MSGHPSVEDLFHRAIEIEPEGREAFLLENCLDDAVRSEVRALLANADSDSILERPPVRLAGPASLSDPTEVGPYRILERIGEGGYGVVYVAEQTEPVRRRVALKLVKAGMDTDKVLARFEAERQALAMMDHPNIARVLDAGTTEVGRPYFVMELVRGEPITTYCDRNRLTIEERLNLFVDVCVAMQHAHQKGVVHRDVKPSNVLIALLDGYPVPKVIDFGIAKATATPLTDRTLHTGLGEQIGTPDYMSPEQADPVGIAPDTTTDVYSLGVLLYELLTGCLPYQEFELRSGTPDRVHQVLSEEDAPRPSDRYGRGDEDALARAQARREDPYALARVLRGDLNWIVIQAMDKDRTRRYQTALEMAREVRRYLDDEPVHAGPPRRWTRVGKFVRRHRVAFGVGAITLAAFFIAAAGVTYSLVESRRQQSITRAAHAESEAVTDFLMSMLASADPSDAGNDVTVRQVLDRESDRLPERFRGQPLLESRMHLTVGTTYRELGEFEPARRHLGQALRLRTAHLPSDDLRVLESRYELAVLARHEGKYDAAIVGLEEVLQSQDATIGPAHTATVATRYQLGSAYMMAEDHETAIPILEEALRRAEEVKGERSIEASSVASTLGLSLRGVGRMEEAETALLHALRVDSAEFGENDIKTVPAKVNLAGLYREMGRYDEALTLYESSTEVATQSYGEEHPTTARYLNNLALCYSDMGRYREAEPISERVVEYRRQTLGDDNPSTMASRLNLSLLYRRLGRYQEAEAESRDIIASALRKFGPEHLYTFIATKRLGASLVGQGRYEEATEQLDQAVRVGRRILGESHWRVGDVLVERGRALFGAKDAARAEEDMLAGAQILESSLGEEHPHFRAAAEALIQLYREQGRDQERERWQARL